MARQQVLHLEPSNELRFRGPFTEVVTSNLRLSNPEERKVLFKVKTTAPKRYCVRPNSGIIEPGASVTVAVMLQPFEYDPTERNKHKFMVQTLFAPDGPIESQEELWKEVTPDNLMDSKLKCVFELPVVDNSHIAIPSSINKESEEKPTKPVKQVQLESSPPTKATSQDAELRKSLEDKHRLEKEVQSLRDEVSSLKESAVRLRKVAMSDTVKSTPAPAPVSSSSQAQALNLPPIVYLIAALVIGIIIGKLIL